MKVEGQGWSGCLLLSTRTTSAPRSASKREQNGPASTWVKSRTRVPAKGPDEALFLRRDIGLFQVELLLGLLKQVPARHLRQGNSLLEVATVQFILNQILERLIR